MKTSDVIALLGLLCAVAYGAFQICYMIMAR